MSVKDVLTLLLTFGMFLLALIGIVIDLIKLSQKNNHLNFSRSEMIIN